MERHETFISMVRPFLCFPNSRRGGPVIVTPRRRCRNGRLQWKRRTIPLADSSGTEICMGDFFVLNNCRRFPRAKLRCDVVYRDRVQSWRGHTEDISFGGCRLSGYYPFALGKPLSLMLTHPSIDEPMVVIGKVACLYGGAQNAIGLAFLNQWRGTSVEDWIRKLIAKDPEALRAGARVPNHLPIEAQLHRAP